MKYERMTPKDSTLLLNEFTQPLGENKAIQYALRLQELENKIESGEYITKEESRKLCHAFYEQGKFDKMADEMLFAPKFKVGDTVWHRDLIPINPDGSLVARYEPLEYRVCKVYYRQKGITYKVKQPHTHAKAYTIGEQYLFATKEEAKGEPQ